MTELDRAGLVQALHFDDGSSGLFYYQDEPFCKQVKDGAIDQVLPPVSNFQFLSKWINEIVTFINTESKFHRLQILAISGSLRRVSSNTALLQAAIALSPANIEMKLYGGLGDLPHFNPDLEATEPPAVTDLRMQVKWADGLIISSPEYAHGVPGVLKNALDWLVGGEEFVDKPIALFNASPRAIHAQASLIEIITTMAGRIIPEASITVSLLGRNLDAAGIIADPKTSDELQAAIISFADAIQKL